MLRKQRRLSWLRSILERTQTHIKLMPDFTATVIISDSVLVELILGQIFVGVVF